MAAIGRVKLGKSVDAAAFVSLTSTLAIPEHDAWGERSPCS